jgi:hypothetical protein
MPKLLGRNNVPALFFFVKRHFPPFYALESGATFR